VKLPGIVRGLLYPFSILYGWGVQARLWMYRTGRWKQKRLNGAVISVGNLTVGGTGKTPMVLWLAEKFLAEGKRVAILSRGYRGADGTSDEIAMLKRRLGDSVAFGVGADRFAEGRRIESSAPVDVFLLDDGFQHLRLARDVDVLLLDGTHPLKNEALLPAGRLREPISAGERADIVVVTRDSGQADEAVTRSRREPFFFAQTRLLGFRVCGERGSPSYLSEIDQRPLFAFCGIGNADAFFADLQRWHVPVAGTMAFRDHHKYGAGDTEQLRRVALACGARGFVTTEKDEQNLRDAGALNAPVCVAVIDFVLSSESEFTALLERLLAERRRRGVSGAAA
jgi:tetraacyldisaccharide 4'-kinase